MSKQQLLCYVNRKQERIDKAWLAFYNHGEQSGLKSNHRSLWKKYERFRMRLQLLAMYVGTAERSGTLPYHIPAHIPNNTETATCILSKTSPISLNPNRSEITLSTPLLLLLKLHTLDAVSILSLTSLSWKRLMKKGWDAGWRGKAAGFNVPVALYSVQCLQTGRYWKLLL